MQVNGAKPDVHADLRRVSAKIRKTLLNEKQATRDLRFHVESGELVPAEEPSEPGKNLIAFRPADIAEETISQELAQRYYWRERLTD